jgi:MAP/microtubule affinity-regulating kinase
MTKEKVAIKVAESNRACLNSILSSENAKDVEMMFKEISALKNLKHKNILKILNAFTLKKEMKVVLVLEYLDGGELKKYVKDNERLGEDECQWFFKQLYHAISYCHREKIIHRDLKLENIMLTDLYFSLIILG